MVLLELFGVDDTEIAADSDAFGPADIGTLEFLVLFFGQIGHGTLELGNDGAWSKGTGG